jgi:hypothetical protein
MISMTRVSTSAIITAFVVIGSSALAAAAPARVPNKRPYRVTATATATGRSGSATMSARALIDRSHHASVEIAAGDFETRRVGTLAKVQLKTFDGNGELISTRNYSGLNASSIAIPIDRMDRGQALQLQGHIRNGDTSRTDVVSVRTVGRLRPDLAVRWVNAPASARVGLPVHISAMVAELNHDTGARASCVLSVDNEEADRAEGIWVDAGDTVSCAFIHVFSTGGAHQIRVDVGRVEPGDWNAANNSGGGSVTILSDEQSFNSVSAWVSESYEHYRKRNTGYSRSNDTGDAYVRTFDFLTDESRMTQGSLYAASISAPVTFPVTQLAVAQWTDDILIHQGVYNDVAATFVAPYLSCGRVADEADVTIYVDVCVRPGASGPVTSITYSRYVGTVTYFSSRYDAAWYETPEGDVPVYTYSYNQHDSSSTGPLSILGNTYRFEVTLINGTVAYRKPVSFAIGGVQTTMDVNYPLACQESSDPLFGYEKVCDEFINHIAGRYAAVDWP